MALNRLPAIGAIWATAVVAFRRGKAEEHIRAALGEKEVLLKEIHHRVKNNLQIVGGLLQLQAAIMVDPKLASALDESRARVISMENDLLKAYNSWPTRLYIISAGKVT